MDSVFGVLFCILFILPYGLLFYKKLSLWIRLLFISLFEIVGMVFSIVFVHSINAKGLIGAVFIYDIAVWTAVSINVILIFLLWISTKFKN
jgi:hypothetical protein